MQIRVKEDSVEVSGYVNAVERKSRPLRSRIGKFVERIRKGAFKRAIAKNDNIRLLLNHNWNKDLGGTKDGNLKLTEDNIGLRADAIITDPEVVQKAKDGELVGWSFGFTDVPDGVDQRFEEGMPTRDVKDLDLFEVSLLDKSRTPAYDGTLVTVRSEEDIQYHSEPYISDVEFLETREEKQLEQPERAEEKHIDYSKYEQLIQEMRED
jgi:hypothetical protein